MLKFCIAKRALRVYGSVHDMLTRVSIAIKQQTHNKTQKNHENEILKTKMRENTQNDTGTAII